MRIKIFKRVVVLVLIFAVACTFSFNTGDVFAAEPFSTVTDNNVRIRAIQYFQLILMICPKLT
ncbi:MAG: hypothetical protein K5656_02485 [Lachnospiraceae bacterium]|nr:hypothetical protein [Lachnospiraceae bacterium]